jgi:hypothetical protein
MHHCLGGSPKKALKLHLLHLFPIEKTQLKCLACSLRKKEKATLDIFVSFFTASAITHSKGFHDTTGVKSDLTKFVCACLLCPDDMTSTVKVEQAVIPKDERLYW